MKYTTTNKIEGYKIKDYRGIVFGEVITGVDFIKDIKASFRDFFGGRSQTYEGELIKARQEAIDEMLVRAGENGANAVVGVKLDYETLGQSSSMLMVIASGTAVYIEEELN